MNTNKIPLTRKEFRERYQCSKTTFQRWIKNSDIPKKIPNIVEKRLFSPNEAKIIIDTFG
jgi:hypothetical protein